MKRAADSSSEPSSKRVKESNQGSPEESASLFDDDKQQTWISNLCNGTDGSGFLQGKVHMIWSLGKKQHILLETQESSIGKALVRVDVFFQGRCAEILKERQVQFGVQDEIQLALRGARMEKKESRSRTSYDIMLKYSEGAQLKFLKRKRGSDNLGVVDTWYITQESAPQEEDWFDPPAPRTLECAPKSLTQLNLPSITPFHEHVAMPPPSTPPEPEHIVIKSESPEPDLLEPKKLLSIQKEHKSVEDGEIPVRVENPQPLITDSPDAAPSSGTAAAERAPAPPLPPKKLSKKERKKLRQVEHQALLQKQREMLVSEQQKPSTNGISSGRSGTPQDIAAQPTAEASSKVDTVEDVASVPVTAPLKPSLPPANPAAPSPINMKAGRKTRYTNFIALADIKAPAICTVAGIVVSLPETMTTRNGDLSCTLKIVDPSNCKMEDDSYRQAPKYSMSVPCFTRQYSKWLPCPTVGDVVILKDVKASNWHGGTNLTGYGDKLQWAIYSPKEQKIHHGDIADIPHDERLRKDGRGHLHTPFYQPRDVDEILYCKKLVEWWDAIEKERERFLSSIINLGDEDGQPVEGLSYNRTARPHWMMKDAKASSVSSGYFDTTVEVVFRFQPQDNDKFFLLFVTDYTENDAFEPFNNSAVHESLAKSIARLECWDASSKVAAQFSVGDYLSLKNVRCRVNNSGSYELKMQEPKLFPLKDTDAAHNVALAELLKRKKAHQDQHGSNDPAELEHRLLKNADLRKISSFVVEILHIASSTGSAGSCLYVSDFTHNPILQGTRLVSKLPQTLDGRVLKVLLFDCHVELDKKLRLGDIVSIRKARITKSYAEDEVNMKLGGNELLITRLNPGVDSHKTLIEQLKGQKADWEASRTDASATASLKAVRQDSRGQEPLTPTTPRPPERTLDVSAEIPKKRKRLHYTPVKEVQAVKSFPERFRIYARIVDFFPTVQEFVHRSCSRCGKDVPVNQRACFSCNDSDHEYVQLEYRFWLKLEDEEGTQIIVSVTDNYPVVRELPRADLAEDKDAYATACRLLDVFFGNTRMYLEERLAGRNAVLSSPLLCCLIINARNRLDEMIYALEEWTLA
ncbi:hypothetical protein Moror_8396 [Moniliophthora roreri MCA 2997]|uniref:Protection of telomeres protein 1 n=2 Tax=Moniliophthora roreri TaxID=221103 RepID=V2XMZ2_MONRO|nr:hypothetical protein Moror_8396 [Moniliophthora roreri MCA 2997]KAI3619353.1 hypothetical protein WG66_012662 [Moniliophthora roreri]